MNDEVSDLSAGPKINDDVVAALSEQAKQTRTTLGEDLATTDALVPPVNNPNQLERVLGYLGQVPDHAEIVTGGKQQEGSGFYVEPTVIAGTNTVGLSTPVRS